MTPTRLSSHHILPLLMLGATTLSASAATVSKTELSEALARHRGDVALCLSGNSNQDRETCLRDAEGALIGARRGSLSEAGETYRANQLKRCTPLPEEQRTACVARIQGAGTTSGSVSSGGIYRELVITETVAPAATVTVEPAPR